MTIAQALEKSAAVKPGMFSDDEKIAWLSQLDAQIDAEVIRTHEGAPAAAFIPYTSGDGGWDTQTMLLAAAPYDKMYVTFLMAQMDFYHADYDKFNNNQRRFEAEYMDFVSWYNRMHMPRRESEIRLGNKADTAHLPRELM